MSEKRYYWLKLYANFFDDDDMRVLLARQNGEQYAIFYLKLLLKAIQQEDVGVLRYKEEVPYTPEILATVTNTDVDTVRVALELFRKLGLIDHDENGSILIEDVHNIGPHYDPTLMAWYRNFEQAWPKLKDKYGDRFYRMWRFYLLTAAASFRARYQQLFQIVMTKEGRPQPACRIV